MATNDLRAQLAAIAAERGLDLADLEAAAAAQLDRITAAAESGHRFRDHVARVKAAATARVTADQEWRAALAEAALAGAPRQLVADAAGVSRQRVSQLVRERTAA